MDLRGSMKLLLLLLCTAWAVCSPLPQDQIDNNVAKRTLDDTPLVPKSVMMNPYMGMLPTMKFGPLMAQAMLMNKLAATAPPTAPTTTAATVDPVAAYFKAKKDEFINKLFAEVSATAEAPGLAAREVTETLPDEPAATTTAKPKIDPTIFMTKKKAFLATLFQTLQNATILVSTTPATPVDPADPAATTVKPTIVPPSFWDFGFGLKTPKPPKPTKAPKPPKAEKPPKVSALDLLLSQMMTPPDTDTEKVARSTFLEKILHLGTEATPIEDSDSIEDDTVESLVATRGMFGPPKPPKPEKPPKPAKSPKPAKPPKPEKPEKPPKPSELEELLLLNELMNPSNAITARSAETPVEDQIADPSLATRGMGMLGPGYWIPPYIYAAKMGLYLDKIYETIDSAAADEAANTSIADAKRSTAPESDDPSSLILGELQSLKNEIILAYTEGLKAKADSKPPTKAGKKTPPWAAKTTTAPDAIQQKMDVLSKAFDSLTAVEKQLVTAGLDINTIAPSRAAVAKPAPSKTATPEELYQAQFLAQLFSENASTEDSG